MEHFSLFIKQSCFIFWSVEKNTESKNPKVVRTKNRNIMLLLKWAKCDSIKEQDAGRLLSSLDIKKPLSKITLVDPLSFW